MNIARQLPIENILRIVAGLFILLSLKVADHFGQADLYDGPTWLWFTALVGLNLFQSGITNWCPLVTILRKLGFRSCCEAR